MIGLKITLEIDNIDGSKTILESQATKEPVMCEDCAFKECDSHGYQEQCAIFNFEVYTNEKYLSFKEKNGINI